MDESLSRNGWHNIDFANPYQGPVACSLVSANRWLRGIKMYRFPWYLTLVSTNHASSNPGLLDSDISSGWRYQTLEQQGQDS